MAAPLSGIGQQQVPLSQPFQPGGSDQTREIRQREQEPRETELQTRGAATAQAQQLNTEDKGLFAKDLENSLSAKTNTQEGSKSERGSVVDITV